MARSNVTEIMDIVTCFRMLLFCAAVSKSGMLSELKIFQGDKETCTFMGSNVKCIIMCDDSDLHPWGKNHDLSLKPYCLGKR